MRSEGGEKYVDGVKKDLPGVVRGMGRRVSRIVVLGWAPGREGRRKRTNGGERVGGWGVRSRFMEGIARKKVRAKGRRSGISRRKMSTMASTRTCS